MADRSDWFLINGRPDPSLAAEIDSDLRQKIKQRPALAEELVKLAAQKAKTVALDDLAASLVFLRENYDLDQAKVIFSHRPVIGPLFVKFKKFLYYLVSDVLELTLQNQATYNFFLGKTLTELAARLAKQQAQIKQLEEKISQLNGPS